MVPGADPGRQYRHVVLRVPGVGLDEHLVQQLVDPRTWRRTQRGQPCQ
ncbi:hypothetical protein [Streptomyces sp. NBC_00358]